MTFEIEQRRRDFMREQPDLYKYIGHRIAAKVYDAAGDHASGSDNGHATANRLWGFSAREKAAYTEMIEAADD